MKPCYIFDIDGTLMNCDHRLHHIQKSPKDWRAFFADCIHDEPIEHICDLVIKLFDADHSIVYVSGRSDECREGTLFSLAAAGLPQAPLYMRKEGDYRDDDILKKEMLAQLKIDGWIPIMAFDDRARVVKMWRDNGVPCCQVAEGDF